MGSLILPTFIPTLGASETLNPIEALRRRERRLGVSLQLLSRSKLRVPPLDVGVQGTERLSQKIQRLGFACGCYLEVHGELYVGYK